MLSELVEVPACNVRSRSALAGFAIAQVIKSLVTELRSSQSVFRFLFDEESSADSTLVRLHDSQRGEFHVLIDGCAVVLRSLDKKYDEIVLGKTSAGEEVRNGANAAPT